jgi:hypothetical protein
VLWGLDSEDSGNGSPSTTPQHSFTKTGWCLCLRGIVACLKRLTCLSKRDSMSKRTGCLRAGTLPAETPVKGVRSVLAAAVQISRCR